MSSCGIEDNLVHMSMECMVWDIQDPLDPVPIVKDVIACRSVCLRVGVQVSENPGATGMDPIGRSLGIVALKNPRDDGISGPKVVGCVGAIWRGLGSSQLQGY